MEFLSSVTSSLLNRSLDIAYLRQVVVAQNVANSGAKDYKPVSVDFGSLMHHLKNINDSHLTDLDKKKAIQDLDLDSYVSTSEMPAQVELDQQIVELNKAVINYQSLLAAKAKLGTLMKSAISGGRT